MATNWAVFLETGFSWETHITVFSLQSRRQLIKIFRA